MRSENSGEKVRERRQGCLRLWWGEARERLLTMPPPS